MANSFGIIVLVFGAAHPPGAIPMARYERSYTGERRSEFLGIQLTPSERDELHAVAKEQDARISDVARAILFRRSAARPNVGGFDKADAVVKRELENSQHANNAVGNLLNQLARHANTTGELGPQRLAELDEALALTRRATELYIAAILHVMAR
jgi:hypothetical protein